MSDAVLTEADKKRLEEEKRHALLDFKGLLLPAQEKLDGLVFFNFADTFEVRIVPCGSSEMLAVVKLINGTLEISKDGWNTQPQNKFTIADPRFNPEKFAVRLSDYIQYNWMQNISQSLSKTKNATIQLKSALTNVAAIDP